MQTRAATETNKRNSERKFDVESAKIPNAAPGFLACTRFAKPGMISIPLMQGNRGCNQILCHLVRNDYHQRYNNEYEKLFLTGYG